jgi:hypothetical protein
MTFLFKALDNVPTPPQWIIDGIDRNKRPNMSEIGYFATRTLKNWNGYNLPAGVNTRQAYPEFEKWVKENVTKHIVDAGVNYVSIEPTDIARSTGAHTDGVRNYVMLWDVELGGDNAELYYWQEKGKPLHRPPKTQGEDLTQLEFIDKIRLPRGKWTLIDTTVLHSVENLHRTRISLHISLLNRLAVETVAGIGDTSFLDA